MNAETILHATIGVLQRRGRCFGTYEYAGKVCVLGAMAVAVGEDPRLWIALQALTDDEQMVKDRELVKAARLLTAVVLPEAAGDDLEDLCVKVGRWHDGELQQAVPRPLNSEVFEALGEAARRAEKAGAAA